VTNPDDAWPLERSAASAGDLHAPWPGPENRDGRAARLCAVRGRRAVVLGSAQPEAVIDRTRAARLGVDVVRRGAGGGAVLVAPAAQVWLDVWLPRGDPLWIDDVIRSSWWLGELWADALAGLGAAGLVVHRARAVRAAWSDTFCFAGVGPGEVTFRGRKLVGLAQRRVRAGARQYSMAHVRWEPDDLLAVLTLDGGRADQARAALTGAAIGLRDIVTSDTAAHDDADVVVVVERALEAALP
jgi:lipoate---protein ligase